jgi:hypothetical protein
MCAGGDVFDNRGQNLSCYYGIPQALEKLEVDQKVERGHLVCWLLSISVPIAESNIISCGLLLF